MSFIQRELDKINDAIRSDKTDLEDLVKLRAAQQALAWATDPDGYKSPYNFIFKVEGKPITGEPQSETSL
jgi:hypothetical protein